MTNVGQVVKVRGEEYKVVALRSCSSSGSKFFGKFRFYLRNTATGELACAFGKAVSFNSKLSEVRDYEREEYGL